MAPSLRNRFSFFIHLGIWCLFFSMPLLPMFFNHVPPTPVIVKICLQMVLVVSLFYVNYLWLIPKYLFNRRRGRYVLLALLLVASNWMVNVYISHLLDIEQFTQMIFSKSHGHLVSVARLEMFHLFISFLAVSVGVAGRIWGRWLQQEKNQESMEKEKLHTELAFLKAQINPHFFFNTMNLIYALTETDTEKAQGAIHKLSKLMRYVLYESERDRIELKREVAFLKDYIELMQMRLPDNVEVSFKQNMDTNGLLVPPLLFVPFVENALKYGVSTQQKEVIEIELKREERLHFYISNVIHRAIEHPQDREGVGLTNVRRRLGLIYPGREFELDIQETGGRFVVNLSIPLE